MALVNHTEEANLTAPAIPVNDSHSDRMVYVYVTNYVINSALNSLHVGSLLRYSVNASLVSIALQDHTIIG